MTFKLLRVDASISGDASISRHLSGRVIDWLRRHHPDAQLVERDVAARPLPYFDARALVGTGVQPVPLDTAQVLEEFMAADVIVVGVPMYNFGIPAQLKTWVDYLAIAGVTFRYAPAGPEGLAGGRRVILVSTRGGVYPAGAPQAHFEHQESYLKVIFGFFGITEIDVVRAEGVKVSPEAAAAAVAAAEAAIEGLRP